MTKLSIKEAGAIEIVSVLVLSNLDARRLLNVKLDSRGEYIVNPFAELKEKHFREWSDHHDALSEDGNYNSKAYQAANDRLYKRMQRTDAKYHTYETFLNKMCSIGYVEYIVTSWGMEEREYALTKLGKQAVSRMRANYK